MIPSRKVLLSLVCGILTVLSLNLLIGTYFEDYEVLIGGLFLHEFTAPMDYSWNANIWFLSTPVIAYFSELFVSIHFYSLLTNALNTLLPISLIYFILSWGRLRHLNKLAKVLLIFIVVFVSLKNVILVSNRRMSLNLLFSSVLFLILFVESAEKNKVHAIISFLLFLMSVFLRFELAMLALMLFSPLFFYYKNKGFWKVYATYLILAIGVFGIFKLLQNTVYEQYAFREKAEHELIDRQSIYFEDGMTEKEAYKLYAMMMFIRDEGVYNADDYGKLLASIDYISYLREPWLLDFWTEKLLNFYRDFDFYLFGIFVMLSAYVVIRQRRYKLIAFFLFVVIIPPLFSFLLIFPVNLYEAILVCIIIGELIVLFVSEAKFSMLLGVLVLVIVPITVWCINFIDVQNHYHDLFNTYRQDLQAYKQQNKEVVFANLTQGFVNYPRRTFSLSPAVRQQHYYLDMFFYSSYNFYLDYHKGFFEDGISDLAKRLSTCTDKEVVFYANEQQKEFLLHYPHYYHDLELTFELRDEAAHYGSTELDLDISLPYRISIHY